MATSMRSVSIAGPWEIYLHSQTLHARPCSNVACPLRTVEHAQRESRNDDVGCSSVQCKFEGNVSTVPFKDVNALQASEALESE